MTIKETDRKSERCPNCRSGKLSIDPFKRVGLPFGVDVRRRATKPNEAAALDYYQDGECRRCGQALYIVNDNPEAQVIARK